MAKAAPRLQSRKGARNCGRARSAASYGVAAAGCGAQRRDGNGSLAARTGHFRLPLVRGALGVPDEQSRPGPWKPEAGGSHSPTFPWPRNRIPALPLARTCPPTEMLVWFRHAKRAGPAQRPALSGQRVFFGPRIELKGCDRGTPAGWASERHQATAFGELPGVDDDRGGAATARLVARGSSSARLLCACQTPAAPPRACLIARGILGASSRHMACRFGAIAIAAATETAEEGCGR